MNETNKVKFDDVECPNCNSQRTYQIDQFGNLAIFLCGDCQTEFDYNLVQ